MATWTRKPQENEGTYFFSGKFLATAGVSNQLPEAEILSIYKNVQAFVKEQNGIDYLQVFEDEKGRREERTRWKRKGKKDKIKNKMNEEDKKEDKT